MIARTTLILEAFHTRTERVTLEEVTRRTGLPRSTVHRILDKLAQLEWLEHLSSGYRLGRRALALSAHQNGHAELRAAAAPVLHALHLQTGLVVHLSVLDRGNSVHLDKVGGRLAAAVPTRVGSRTPAYATAGGKALLAGLPSEHVDRLYGRHLASCTERTISDIATLHTELASIRGRRGVALERGEFARGVACVGAAVQRDDGPVAAISLAGDVRTIRLDHVAPLVVDATRTLDASLLVA
ncbi:IclR family transcriptional regulator [Rhodococcus sp. ACT016]|uniref:IclR family transcriptional regulator n=1 Tax=Rhodococcus sp. ACT016 TaxID=3134808 RepID=UPI003D2CD453